MSPSDIVPINLRPSYTKRRTMYFHIGDREESKSVTDVCRHYILSDSKNRYLTRYQFRCDL